MLVSNRRQWGWVVWFQSCQWKFIVWNKAADHFQYKNMDTLVRQQVNHLWKLNCTTTLVGVVLIMAWSSSKSGPIVSELIKKCQINRFKSDYTLYKCFQLRPVILLKDSMFAWNQAHRFGRCKSTRIIRLNHTAKSYISMEGAPKSWK
jgi:hypothetical protein